MPATWSLGSSSATFRSFSPQLAGYWPVKIARWRAGSKVDFSSSRNAEPSGQAPSVSCSDVHHLQRRRPRLDVEAHRAALRIRRRRRSAATCSSPAARRAARCRDGTHRRRSAPRRPRARSKWLRSSTRSPRISRRPLPRSARSRRPERFQVELRIAAAFEHQVALEHAVAQRARGLGLGLPAVRRAQQLERRVSGHQLHDGGRIHRRRGIDAAAWRACAPTSCTTTATLPAGILRRGERLRHRRRQRACAGRAGGSAQDSQEGEAAEAGTGWILLNT